MQSFQLVRGGSIAELRGREILKVLPALARHGCLPAAAVAELTDAYLFLRRMENSHPGDRRPADPPGPGRRGRSRPRRARARLRRLGARVAPELERHRAAVGRHFRDIVFRGEAGVAQAAGEQAARGVARGGRRRTPPRACCARRDSPTGEPAAVLERLRQLRAAATLQRLDEPGRQRLDALVPAVLDVAARQKNPLLAVDGVALVIEADRAALGVLRAAQRESRRPRTAGRICAP